MARDSSPLKSHLSYYGIARLYPCWAIRLNGERRVAATRPRIVGRLGSDVKSLPTRRVTEERRGGVYYEAVEARRGVIRQNMIATITRSRAAGRAIEMSVTLVAHRSGQWRTKSENSISW